MPEWELNYTDRETLRPHLVSRCVEAVRKYLLYVLGNGSETQPRKDWAEANMANLQSIGHDVSHYITSEPTFIAGGTSITDAAIQSRVETILNAYYLPGA